MGDNSLRVNPAVLDDGAARIRDAHEALRAVLAKIHDGHGALEGVWTGETAARSAETWSHLHTAFGTHVDRLADNADALRAAAELYRQRDDGARGALDQQV